MKLATLLAALAGLLLMTISARSEGCIVIVSVPVVLSQQGAYCFNHDLATSITTGSAIKINTSNVTIDMNGFKLGGLGGGASTTAIGFSTDGFQNITIRNGTIRGFAYAVQLSDSMNTLSGAIVENLRVDSSRVGGISVAGKNSIVRNSSVFNIGGSNLEYIRGILVSGANNTIERNSVSSVVSIWEAVGIEAHGLNTIIRSNDVRNVNGSQQSGNIVVVADKSIIQDNNLMNQTIGTWGIWGHGDVDICIDNIAINFTLPFVGCEVSTRNEQLAVP